MIEARREKKLSLLFLAAVTAATLYLSYVIARPFLTPILTATLLAIAVYPLFRRLTRHVTNRSGAALLATLLVLLAILLPAVFIIDTLAHETAAVYGWLNEQKTLEGGWKPYADKVMDPPLGWVSARTGMSQEQLKKTALDRFQNLSASLLKWGQSLLVNVGSTLVDTVIMLLTLFFLLRDGEWFR